MKDLNELQRSDEIWYLGAWRKVKSVKRGWMESTAIFYNGPSITTRNVIAFPVKSA